MEMREVKSGWENIWGFYTHIQWVYFFMSANFRMCTPRRFSAAQQPCRRVCLLVWCHMATWTFMTHADPSSNNSSLTLVSSAEDSRSPELGWSRKVMQPQSVEAHTVTGTETHGLRCRSGVKTHHTHIWWNLVVRPPDWHDRNVYFSLKTFNALMQSNMQH